MSQPRWSLIPHRDTDKRLVVLGPGDVIRAEVDFDDVDQGRVLDATQRMVATLNAGTPIEDERRAVSAYLRETAKRFGPHLISKLAGTVESDKRCRGALEDIATAIEEGRHHPKKEVAP